MIDASRMGIVAEDPKLVMSSMVVLQYEGGAPVHCRLKCGGLGVAVVVEAAEIRGVLLRTTRGFSLQTQILGFV